MKVYKVEDLRDYPKLDENSCVIGNFDGIHQGHQDLILKTKVEGLKTLVITFEGLTKMQGILTNTFQREKIMESLGVDYLIVLDYEKIKNCFWDEFVKFLKKIKVKIITCGKDFRFGYQGEGDIIDLENNFKVNVINYTLNSKEKISTTTIKHLLTEGNLDEANKLLTRNYEVIGTVFRGSQIGRTLGYPTANVDYGMYYLPKNGVYWVKVRVLGKTYDGMANIGHNPTLNLQHKLRLEVNILDFEGDIYYEQISVQFIKRLREEVKYPSKEALIKSLSDTVSYIKNIR